MTLTDSVVPQGTSPSTDAGVLPGNPVTSAVVRVFTSPAPGADASASSLPAVELGQAMTTSTGTFEMFLTPYSP
jgi:hypothetical protein